MTRRCKIRRVIALLVFVAAAYLLYVLVEIDSDAVVPQSERESEVPGDGYINDQSDISDYQQLLSSDVTRTVQKQIQDAMDELSVGVSPSLSPISTDKALGLKATQSSQTNEFQTTKIDISATRLDTVREKSYTSLVSCSAFPLLSNDGFVRNCITNDIIGQIPKDLKTALFRPLNAISPEVASDRKQSFQKVFDTRAWGHDWDVQHKGLNASGMGATLHWTQEAMAGLHVIVNQLKVAYNVSRIRMLDVPCGDMAWMSRFLKTRDDIDYTGVDIVPDLIHHHRQAFKSYPWKFQLADLVSSPLNESYHLILCRTLLQHLYNHDAVKLLNRISTSGSGFLLVTSFLRHKENQELVIDAENPGRFRRLNLELKPFALTPPQCLFRDGPPDAYEGWEHFLALWKLPLRKLRRCKMPIEFELRPMNVKISSCTNWSLTG